MHRTIKTLHTYAGLLTFVNLMVYGIAGFSSMWHRPGDQTPAVSERAFTVPPNLTDKEVAERICLDLGLTLAMPVQNAAIHRDAAGGLWLDLWHVNGRHKVTVLEKEGRIRIEERRGSVASYLNGLHATTAAFRGYDWRMMLWAYYNEFAMWCLGGMIASGTYLWLATRPRHTLALVSLSAGTATFAALYIITR